MNMFIQDLRHSFRALVRNPGFTAVAALSLAIGIGANAALFSVNDAMLWRPLPVLDPGSIVNVIAPTASGQASGDWLMSYPNYRDIRDGSKSFDGLVAHQAATLSFARSREAVREMRLGMLVSENFFDVLGIVPALGRAFTPQEGRVPGRDAVVVLGYDFWMNTLGGDPSIVGDIVPINGIDFTVIGVAPESFSGIEWFSRPSFYMPIPMADRLNAFPQLGRLDEAVLEERNARVFVVKGRLRPRVSLHAAETELSGLWAGLVREYPDANRDRVVAVRTELQERRRRDPGNSIVISMMTALAALVLMIACANVANLMLGRARARSREIAIRLALGVSRPRLLRQLLTETLLIALIGCALGIVFAYGSVRFIAANLQATVQTDLPIGIDPKLDGRFLIVSLLAAIVSAVFFGLAPAWQSLKTQLVPSLKISTDLATRHRTIGRNFLVSSQVALSMVLLVVAGLLLEGLRVSQEIDPGFRMDRLVMISTDTALLRYTAVRTRDFYRELGERVRALPGVASATLTSSIPLGATGRELVVPEGFQFPRGQHNTAVASSVVDEHYFGTLGIGMLRGRSFSADDVEASRRVVIVNDAFARTYWPDQDPVGKRIWLNDSRGPMLEVVGMVRTGKYLQVTEAPRPFLYIPFAQSPRAQMSLLVETRGGDPAALGAPLREVVRAIDVDVPVFNVRSFSTFFQRGAIGPQRLVMRVVSAMGVIGLTLALIGLYGLVAYSVSRRTREIGIRMAMGAGASDVLRMVLRQGLTLSIAGVVVGGAASVVATRLVTSALAGAAAPNVATYVVVPLALVGLTLAASYIPARRAATVQPTVALRTE